MFDNVKRRATSGGTDNCQTVVGAGSSLTGEITCKGPSRIAGKIDGQLRGDNKLILSQTADITGDVFASEIEIDGKVTGTITATERLVLNETAIVEGDLQSPSVVIEEGAVFNGKSTMPSRTQAPRVSAESQPQLPPATQTQAKETPASSTATVHPLEIKSEKKTASRGDRPDTEQTSKTA